MNGKIVLITGANSGIGFVTARELAKRGAEIVMVCRDPGRGAEAAAAVRAAAAGPPPELLIADMSSQVAVRTLADQVHRRFPRIDVLINNAGAIFARRELTADGIEKTFATNHLGPFLLTNLLLDMIETRPGARIVNVAAESFMSRLDFDNLQGETAYGFLSAYFRSKLENIIFTVELARRLEGSGVTVNCMSPGPTQTRFGHDMTGLVSLFPRFIKRIFPSAETGARTVIYLASSPKVAGISGRFFMREKARRTKAVAHDRAVAARLWQVSADLVGLASQGARSTETPAKARRSGT